MNPNVLKFLQVIAIVLVTVGLDQWTKMIASDRLATSRSGHFNHYIHLEVPNEFDGKTVREYLKDEFMPSNTAEEIDRILMSTTTAAGVRVEPGQILKQGEALEVRWREIVVIPDHWDWQYTRNPGAAFSFMADMDAKYRAPFFIVVSFIAVFAIFWILRGVTFKQQLLIWALALLCGGAIGNLIDRIAYQYVIDFIVWKWTNAYRWPTFNLADAFICIGVSLMFIEMIRDGIRERNAKKKAKAGGADSEEAAASA